MKPARSLRILLVEDQELVRTTLRAILHMLGHEVREACHGGEALKQLRESVPDLILSDMDMPEMNGEAMCRALSEEAAWANLPVVLMTGYDYLGVERARKVLPQAAWLSKPFTFEQLCECLGKVLQR